MGPMSVRMNLPGPFSARLRGLSLRQQIAEDKKTARKAREDLRYLRSLFTRRDSKKIRQYRKAMRDDTTRAVQEHRANGTIT